MSGSWYSICWSPRDYSNPNSFIELDGCPRFHFLEPGRPLDIGKLEQEYPHLSIKEIFKTEIFVKDMEGTAMPTHYRHNTFMPGDNPAYDAWLQKSFAVNGQILDKIRLRQELFQKNMFLEHSSKIIRHDMHSGINTYMPRGMSMLLEKLPKEVIEQYKLAPALTLLEKGLKHTQKVYKGVYAFTNLVKETSQLDKETFNLKEALVDYLSLTSYHNQVEIADLCELSANKSLLCTAIDNLIRNGLKYNDSPFAEKKVKIYMVSPGCLGILDNGRGMTQEEFEVLSLPYKRKAGQTEDGTGLGLNICVAILNEHDFYISVEKQQIGTLIKITLGN